ncbi:g568 [Coccomyxa elongata]
MALFGGGSPALPQFLNLLGGGSISVTLTTTGPNNQNSYITSNNQTVVDTANSILLNISTLTVQNVQAQSLTTSYLNAGSNTNVTGVASAGTLLSSVLTLPKSLQPPLPVSGSSFYIDPADNVLKGINSFGTLTSYSPENSRGDIAVHTGTTLARLPVGTVGSTLVADPTQTQGIRWGQVSSIPGSYGSEYNYTDSLGSSTTTNRSFQTKATLTTNLLLGGTYLFQVSYSCSNTQTNKFFEVSVVLDGTTTVHDNVESIGAPNYSHVANDFSRLVLAAGVHTFVLQYRNVDPSSVNIRLARMQLLRIS